jgi:hypothetical protein
LEGDSSGDIYAGLMASDQALEQFKITGTEALGRPYFNVRAYKI